LSPSFVPGPWTPGPPTDQALLDGPRTKHHALRTNYGCRRRGPTPRLLLLLPPPRRPAIHVCPFGPAPISTAEPGIWWNALFSHLKICPPWFTPHAVPA